MTRDEPVYVLGHATAELERLERQAALFAPVTREVLQQAGVGPGQRVMDIGCGAGDVSLLLADLVGPTGFVVGVDRADAAVVAARRRAAARGLSHVEFRQGDLEALDVDPVDAVVGRFVLMHQADPARALAQVSSRVRSGGRIVMVESHLDAFRSSWPSWPSWPSSSAYATVIDLVCRTVAAAGGRTDMGLRLRSAFLEAGLADPEVAAHAVVAGAKIRELCRYWGDSLRSMAASAAHLGVAQLTESAIAALERAMEDELDSPGAVMVAPLVVTAWSVKP